MTRHSKAGLAMTLVILLAGFAAWPADQKPEPLTPEEQREQLIIKRFQSVLEKNPRRGTALDRLYGYHVERGSLDKLIREYRERVKSEPANGTASMIVGLLEAQRGRDAEAVTAFREAEKRLPNNALASYYLGQSLVMVGQPEAAAEAFERAIARKPNRTDLLDIFQALGRVYQRAQHSDKALAVWARLEQLFPDDLRVQEQIAATLAEEGQFEQALPRYEKLAKEARDPYQKTTFRMEAAELKIRLKQTQKALADFEALLAELNPENWLYREVRRKIEDVFLRNDDQAGLAKYYEGWIAKNPNDIDAIARLAHTLSSQGRMPEAHKWLKEGIAKAPSRRELRQALIEQLLFEQKYGEAAAEYEAMDKADPNNPDTLREWGKLLLRDTARPEAQRKQAAYEVWNRLLKRRPKDAVTAAQVADLVRSAGMIEEAIALYKKAIELAPESPQYREYLGEYYHSLKRSEEALAAWRPIAEGTKRTAKNLARLGEVLSGFGYRKEAAAAFADAVALEKDDINLRLRYAELLHLEGRNDDALAQLDAAGKLISNAEEAESVLQEQIKIYQATDTLSERTETLQKELDAGKNSTAERWHRLARYYEANRQMAEATAAIHKALELDPKSIAILASAARIHETGGNLLLAADTNRKLAALDRRFRTEYLTAVAKLEARLGRRAEALQAGRDLLAAAPGNPEHYKFFAELCFQLGESEEGLESLRRSVRANPSEPQGLLTLANALAERFRTGEAIELCWRAFEKTTELDGKLAIVSRLTELYLQNNQFDRLLERLERERREADKQREMTICLAQAYQAAGDLGTARQQLERLLGENSRDTQLLQQLSQLSENEGDNALALKYQRLYVQAAPKSHDGQLRLAQLLVKADEPEEAAQIWVQLVVNEPEPHRNLQAIDALFSHHKPETVLAITRRLLAQKPGDWELLYREGAALGALDKQEEAIRRFQALLDLRLPDDEEGAALQYSKKQKPSRSVGTSANTNQPTPGSSFQVRYNPDDVPLERRTQNVWEIRAFTGLDPRYIFFVNSQQRTWMPIDYGQARLGAMAWLMGFAQKKDQGDAFLKGHRPGRGTVAPRVGWDWYYLQQLRMDWREVYAAARELARTPDPAAQWAYLHSLSNRTHVSGRYYRPIQSGMTDTTPALPAEELNHVVAAFQRLRKEKPQWMTESILKNVLTELKRARRTKDEEKVYRDAVAAASSSGQMSVLQSVLAVAADRGDLETALQFFDRVEKLQDGSRRSWIGPQPLRQAAQALGEAMRARADAKAHAGIPQLYRAYLKASRRQQKASGRVASRSFSSPNNQTYYSVYVGRNRQSVVIDFPQPNEYLDGGAIELLRNAFELYKRDDLLSDLFAHFRQELEKATAAEKVYLRLTLAALHWWNHEHEQAMLELNAASDLVPSDVNLRLEVARLRESNNEPQEALAILESITPLDHTTMQKREIAALRLAVRTGNVDRARQAADRLFGLRLDAETQVKLAAQMHQLGMHDAAEKVLSRAQRQAGHRTAALISLMHQYQAQNQLDLALQIAHKLLRKTPSVKFTPYYYYNREADGRQEAIQVLVRSGKLNTMIERAEAQLKSSPKSLELHQTLLDYYKAAGDKKKVKDIAERMAKVRPDDGKVKYQAAQQLQQIGELAAAADHYKEVIRKEPALFAYNYWQIQQVFDQLRKTEELIQLIEEIDLRTAGNYWAFVNMLQPLFSQERTRPQGLKLLRKIWKSFPQERSYIMGSLYRDELWHVPEIYDYARQAVIPSGDDPFDPWRGSDQIIRYSGDGRVNGVITRLLEAATRQNRLRSLTREIEQVLAKHPEWSAGKALLAILNLQRGRVAEARRAWRELLDDKQNPMPMISRFIFGQEIQDYESMRDLALETFEGGVEETLNNTNMFYNFSPIRALVHAYQDAGRKKEARALLLRCANAPGYSFNVGYRSYMRIENASALAEDLVKLGYPVDAVRLCGELFEDSETIEAALTWSGPWIKQQAEQALKTALKGLKPETLAESVRDLLAPRPTKQGSGQALDLLLLLQPRELPDAQVTSMLERALLEAAKKPEMQAEARASLKKLLSEYPQDMSVRIAATLETLHEVGRSDAPSSGANEAVAKLLQLVEARPLEQLAEGKKANARQRAEASRQIGLWLVARQCLRHPALRSTGEKMGLRAVEAARRQREPHFALAMLREWGQIELDRGDTQAAQKRWAEMLRIVLPERAKEKGLGSRVWGLGEDRLVFAVVPQTPSPAPAAPPAKTQPANSKPQTPNPKPSNGQVPAATIQQFENATRIARLAAEHKMFALSWEAVRDALLGGPPVSIEQNNDRRGIVMAGGPANNPAPDSNNQHNQTVASQLAGLVADWRRGGVAEENIYATLVDVVLPEARPSEVFLYAPPSSQDPTQASNSVGLLLSETAVKAKRVEDLRKRLAARQDKPLGELNARVLLAHLAAASKDDAAWRKALEEFNKRLEKDNLQYTAGLVCQVAAPALSHADLAATARPVLERAAKNLIAAGAEEAAVNVLLFLARHDFEQGRTKEGKARLKETTDLARRTSLRGAQNGPFFPGNKTATHLTTPMQRVVREYLRVELFAEVLDLFALTADLPPEQRSQIPTDALNNLLATFARQFAKRPARERYDLLKSWSFPTATRKSIRILGGFVPTDTPPADFGKFNAPADGVVCTPDLLIDAARQAGQFDALTEEVQKLAAQKVENAAVLDALIQIARGKGATVQETLRQQMEQVRKKLFAPPPIRSPYYWGGPEQSGPSVEWTEFLLARACLHEASLAASGEALAQLLMALAKRSSSSVMLIHLREEVAAAKGRRPIGRSSAPSYPKPSTTREPGLTHWHPASAAASGNRHGGELPAWWVAHEGYVAHLLGEGQDFLIFDYPLTGTFEFSIDAYHGGWPEGNVGYAGLVFEPSSESEQGNGRFSMSGLWPVGRHEQLYLPTNAMRPETFNRYTIQVAPDKVRWLVNGLLVHEQADPSPTSPWLALYAGSDRHAVFRNPQLVGTPQIPREVHLSHGDRLEGWVSQFYNDSQPNRLNKEAEQWQMPEQVNQGRGPSAFDWFAREGEILGRRSPDLQSRSGIGSLLSYFRPLRPGETLRYEFYYRPGEMMVHPSLGRLAFLLEPEGVRLHWLTENDDSDWTGLAADNAVSIGKRQSRQLPFKVDAWNQLQLSTTAGAVKIELNGAVLCERELEADNPRTFGLFHYKDRTAVRVRNIVLTGTWPQKLNEKDQADFLVRANGGLAPPVRRQLIGDNFYYLDAGRVLRQARALPDAKAYELLREWVLPSESHPVFQLAGEFTPADPAPPVAPPLPPPHSGGEGGGGGHRVPTGGELQAPALELVALAKKLGKLDELAERVQSAQHPGLTRGRLAMLALVYAAQEKDEQARTALTELRRLITPLPLDEPIWQRWPELVAASGVVGRKALLEQAEALLDPQVKRLEQAIRLQIPQPGRDPWGQHVRQARAKIQVLRTSTSQSDFGADPGLKHWVPVTHNGAMPRGTGAPHAHWTREEKAIKHYPGRNQDYLYLRMPIQGDFELSCELTSFGWREAQVAYGGLRFELHRSLKKYNLYSFDRLIRSGDIDPPLPDLGAWYKFRLVVRGDAYIVSINDRKMIEESLLENADPWLMLHADHANTAGFRNVKITGKPNVPEKLALSALPDLTGWVPYEKENKPVDDFSHVESWQKRGEEIKGTQTQQPNRDNEQLPRPRSWTERALHYHRPLLEDGTIEYDFYYEPDKVQAHPALDRLVFLLEPQGVGIHWLTDGIHDRTGLQPDNATTEPKNRRGPAALPLKAKDWNHTKLVLTGDTVTLHLNGIEIYQRLLEPTNQRTFGLFHYADETALRVRNVTYRGQWPRRFPEEGLGFRVWGLGKDRFVFALVPPSPPATSQTLDPKPQTLNPLPEPTKFDPKPTPLGDDSAEMLAVVYSPDREILATGGADKLVKLWDVSGGKPIASLAGHNDAIASLVFSRDGKLLASASYDQTIKLWDVATRKERRTLSGHKNWVYSVAFAPDGKTLASASYDRNVKIWDVATGAERATLKRHKGTVRAVAFSPDGQLLASSGADRRIRLWDTRTWEEKASLEGHEGTVRGLAFSPDGQWLASVGEDRVVKLWDTHTGKEARSLEGHNDLIFSVAFSPRGQLLATGSFDRTIKLWEAKSGAELATLEGHSDGVTCLAFAPSGRQLASAAADRTVYLWDASLPHLRASRTQRLGHGSQSVAALAPDGSILAAAGSDRTIQLYDVKSWQVKATLRGHRAAVVGLAFSPDGKLLASASRDRTARLWSVVEGRPIASLGGHRNAVRAVAFSPDGKILATAGSDRTILLWDVPDPAAVPNPLRERATWSGHETSIACLAFSPDGKWLASGADKDRKGAGIVKLWDVSTGKEKASWSAHEGGVTALAFVPHSELLVSGGNDAAVRLWQLTDPKQLLSRKQRSAVRTLAFTPDGKHLVSGHAGSSLVLWNTDSWQEQTLLMGHQGEINSVAFAPDGRSLITAGQDEMLKQWDLEPRQLDVVRFIGHDGWVTAVALLPDGRRLLSGSWDGTLRLWDAANGKEIAVWEGHTDKVQAVALRPDGRLALSAGSDRTVRLWDVADGKEVRQFKGHTKAVTCAAFSPDGRHAATGSRDGTVRLWEVATGRRVCMLKGLTDAVYTIAFAPDGRTILAGGLEDNGCALWDPFSDKKRGILAGNGGPVLAAAFAPDGRQVLTGGTDRILRLWDVASAKEIRRFEGHAGYIRAVSFTPDGRYALTGSYDHTVRWWDVTTGQCCDSFELHEKPVLCVGLSPDGRRAVAGGADGIVCLWKLMR